MTPSAILSSRARAALRFTWLSVGCAALLACAPERRAGRPPIEAIVSRCDLFVRSHTQNPAAVELTLLEAKLRDSAGEMHAIELSRARFSSLETQLRLPFAGAVVPPATYDAIVLRISQATLQHNGTRHFLVLAPMRAEAEPAPGEPEPKLPEFLDYEVPVRFELRQHDAVSVFLEWDVDNSVIDGTTFQPKFSVTLEVPQVRLGLIYIADSAAGSVVALNRFTGQIVGTAKVGARPTGIALTRDRQRLFVANAGDGSVSVVDLSLNFAVSTIPIRLGAETSDVVLSDDGLIAATTNTALDTVSLFDAPNFARLADLRVGRAPVRLAAVPNQRRIAVVNSQSNDLSIIDTFARTVVATVAVEAEPTDIAIDRRGREIYVAHRISQNLLVLDASTLQLLKTIHVGGNMTAVKADRQGTTVFVARDAPNEIVAVEPSLSSVVRRIPISARVEALAQGAEAPLLYGAAPARGGLIVVNTVLSREQSFLPGGAGPFDVLAID